MPEKYADERHAIILLYEELDLLHHGRMHRGGLAYLVSQQLPFTEDEVHVVINEYFGARDDAEPDHLPPEKDDLTDEGNSDPTPEQAAELAEKLRADYQI
jgi:hypothetical protein